MKLSTQLRILNATMIALICTLFFVLGHGVGNGVLSIKHLTSNSINNCTGDFMQSVQCMQQDLSSWYNYNLTNLGKKMTEEEFKTNGGVCSHASEWYGTKAKALGFNAQQIIIYDSVGEYCVVDQTTLVGCIKLNGSASHQFVVLYH